MPHEGFIAFHVTFASATGLVLPCSLIARIYIHHHDPKPRHREAA